MINENPYFTMVLVWNVRGVGNMCIVDLMQAMSAGVVDSMVVLRSCGGGALGEPERKEESQCGDMRLLKKQRNCHGVADANDDNNSDLDAITDNITVTVICAALLFSLQILGWRQ
uniref:Uncharacterized protein n=1 Tax=Tanacetum cinerariifolium TaxID=118510 RepID=A0A6L2KZS4_TANCI|nr:hypothetical protein [Tanacetum cinerariifolium]